MKNLEDGGGRKMTGEKKEEHADEENLGIVQ